MRARVGFLWLAVLLAMSFTTACDEEASIGERDAATSDAGTTGDASMLDAHVVPDAGPMPGDAGTDAAVAIGLAHLEIELTAVAADTIPAVPSSMFSVIVRGLDRAPEAGTPVSPVETFGPCRVGGGEVPGEPPSSVDLGTDTVEIEIGSAGRQPMTRVESDGDVRYFSGQITPAPAPGTVVHAYVTLAGHTYEATSAVSALTLTAPALVARPSSYEIAYTAGEDLVVSWTPNGDPAVRFDNLRYDPSGGGGSSSVVCDGDASTSSFTIPARIVSTYMQNAPGASTDSVMVLFTHDRIVTTDGALTIGVSRVIRAREGAWPHG
jgi:hypothetical protein